MEINICQPGNPYIGELACRSAVNSALATYGIICFAGIAGLGASPAGFGLSSLI